MRPYPLTAMRGGINRLRVKGGARADMFYDLTNAFITNAASVQVREGTIRNAALTSSSAGLAELNGQLNVFSNALISVPSGYVCNVLVDPNDVTQAVTKIWFAKPFMGFLYVVAQFANGDVFHYWLQSTGTWAANTVYTTSSIILPPTPNGLAYQAVSNITTPAAWSAQAVIAAGALVAPTNYTGYMYRAIAVAGTTPHTSSIEPIWPIVIGGTIQEFGDFDTSSTSVTPSTDTATTGTPLNKAITDRYGDSATIANSGTTTAGSASTTAAASTAVTTWAPGTNYAPGAVVQPSTTQGAFVNAIPNGDFEAGNDGNWILSGGVAFDNTDAYQGTECLSLTASHSTVTATMNTYGAVTTGQSVTATAYLNPNNNGANLSMVLALRFYDSSDTFLYQTVSPTQQGFGYRQTSVTGTASGTAAHVRVQVFAVNGTSSKTGFADLVAWNLSTPVAVSNFLYEAVQAAAAASGSSQPTWPTISGNTVIDGGVTWKAIGTSIITWQAIPLMLSGGSAPTFPTTIGNSVSDASTYTSLDGYVTTTTMSWKAIDRHIPDTNNPNTIAVALGASHVFAGNKDICSYSAAVDPTDWSSSNNAGYLPTGLNNYGDNPVAVLALYRSNLVVFNSNGYQMWQIDPDPANMALLDAQAVGSIYTQAAQSVANDLLFLTEVGVRNISTAGATANMQLGTTGQAVDPLVRAALRAATYKPISLYYPGKGQYWLIFGPQAFVLTVNGANGVRTWSRYIFPDSITDWALSAGILYLRTAGNLVWQLDDATTVDDAGGANTGFLSVMQWPYLDAGALGINKMMIGIDLIGTGAVTIQLAYREDDPTTFSDNAGFATSLNVTAPYTISAADTVPGTPIPIPVEAPSYSLILTWSANQAWSWQAANLYLSDRGGATG